jgi:leader peptidase (prepilin peptidase) / N-methyltransferase
MFEIIRLFLYILVLIILAVFDLKRGIIPNKIVYPAIILTILLNIFSSEIGIVMSLIGGFSLAAFLFITSLVLKNMGMGDVKLALLIGLMTGFPEGIIALFSGIFIGGLAAIFLVVTRLKKRKDTMPYGPFLVGGAVFTLIGVHFSLFDFLYRLSF